MRLKSIGDLTHKIFQTGKNDVYSLVYWLLTLVLILPVVTAIVGRVFFAMNFVKTLLHNRMRDQLLNDTLLVYVEKDIFNDLNNETIMRHFQGMKTHRRQL